MYKNGDKREDQDFRSISLWNIVYQIMAVHIKNKLMERADQELGENQYSVRQGRGMVDQVFVLRKIQAESQTYGKSAMLLRVDYKQTNYKIRREELYRSSEQIGVNNKFIRIIKLTLTGTKTMVENK